MAAIGERHLFVRGGRIVTLQGDRPADVRIRDGLIDAVGPDLEPREDEVLLEADGRLVFPGLIDSQVHFREPGLEHKEDLQSGALAAVAGGVTAFMEMPNTKPNTTTPEALEDKLGRAKGRARADHAFFLGATTENADLLGGWEGLPGCAGIKVFMGSSTGTLLVEDDATLERVLRSGERRVAIHAEHEPRLVERQTAMNDGATVGMHPEIRDVETAVRATRRLLDLAERTGRKVHLLHVSTAEEVAILRERDLGDLVTAEATPNHLFLHAPDCYERWGSLVQMNPPVRGLRHRDAIRQGLVDGVLWCVGSDHAPHTLEEKARAYPKSPSGIPGVQTILPLLLTAVREGWLRLPDIIRVMAEAPTQIYGIRGKGRIEPGYDGDLTIVDPTVVGPLRDDWIRSRAGYSPFAGWQLAGWPVTTALRGRVVYRDHETVGEPDGLPLRFA